MKTQIEYRYKVDYIPKRCWKTRTTHLKDTMAVTIKEPTAEEFPTAFIVHNMQSVLEGMKSYEDYESGKCRFRIFAEEIRTYKGKLYTPVRVTWGAAISTVFEDENYIVHNLERLSECGWYKKDDDGFSETSTIVSENKNEMKAIIRNAAKDYIRFEDKFWKRCGEPMYVVITFGLGHNHGGTSMFIESHYNENIGKQNYFNALERDKAIAYGKKVAENRGDTNYIKGFGEDLNIEVLMPEMVKRNPQKEHGDGDEFMNMLKALSASADSASEAAALVIAATLAEIKE